MPINFAPSITSREEVGRQTCATPATPPLVACPSPRDVISAAVADGGAVYVTFEVRDWSYERDKMEPRKHNGQCRALCTWLASLLCHVVLKRKTMASPSRVPPAIFFDCLCRG